MNTIKLYVQNILLISILALTIGATPKAMALTNSQPALSDEFMPMVIIRPYVKDQSGVPMQGFCNATFIHPQALVTAAHCLAEAYQMRKMNMTIQFGKYKYVTRPNGTVVRVGYATLQTIDPIAQQFLFTNSLKRRLDSGSQVNIAPEEDLAIIILPTPVAMPEPIPYAKTASQQELRGLYNSLISYQPTVLTVNFMAEIRTSDTKRSAVLNSLQASTGSWTSKSSSRVEEGDSGAALLARIGKEWKLVGVVKGHAQTVFSEWDVYSAADNKVCEMSQLVSNPEIQTALCH